jgi:AcrR family transcriptional regulator
VAGTFPNTKTRARILDGALRAVEEHGLAKLGMSDVSRSAGVSRGTLYRYFPTRDKLIDAVGAAEGARFFERVLESLAEVPAGEERIALLIELANRHVREHRALQRLLETEPAFVLQSLRDEYPRIRDAMAELLLPVFEGSTPVLEAGVTAEQLVDWTLRLMISAFLLPSEEPDEMQGGLLSIYRYLNPDAGAAPDSDA